MGQKKVFVTTGNIKTLTKYKKNNKVLVPYMSSECSAAVILNIRTLIKCDLLVVKEDYSHLDNDRLTEIFIAQKLGIKVVYEFSENEFEFDLSINANRKENA